jgi:hypothetical protein
MGLELQVPYASGLCEAWETFWNYDVNLDVELLWDWINDM